VFTHKLLKNKPTKAEIGQEAVAWLLLFQNIHYQRVNNTSRLSLSGNTPYVITLPVMDHVPRIPKVVPT